MKFVFIQWVGENVKPMTKGKISTHKSTVEKAFHVSFAVSYDVLILVSGTLYRCTLVYIRPHRNLEAVHFEVPINSYNSNI